MAKLTHIRGCGPMVCSDYREISAAIDQAFDGPRNSPLRWSTIVGHLEARIYHEPNPLADPSTLKIYDIDAPDHVPQPPGQIAPG